VLDFSTVIAGPYGAAMIADLGARVIKVDATPEREQVRGSAAAGAVNTGNLKLYAGKEHIQVDLQTEEGQRIVHQLIENSDVLLHNFRPGVPRRLGIDWETCQTINPRLVHVYIGAYGATGPHSRRPGAHPLPGALFGGALRQAGASMPPSPDEPMDLAQIRETARWLMRANEGNPDPNSSQAVGTSIMLGLYAREVTGRGQPIQATMMQANAWANADEAYDFEGRPGYRIPDADCYGLHALYRLYKASEGWVFLAALTDREWQSFTTAVDRPDLASDPRFATADDRREHDEDLIVELAGLFGARAADEWEATLTAADVACVRADGDSGTFFEEHPHALANNLAVETESPRFGKYKRHGGIVQFSDTPGRYGPGPFPGEHTVRLMEELGYDRAAVDALREKRVVDWEDVNRIAAAI
jgi:crotonobetainyl-CoA:carnitine CoA-transferase CaiB-like acyl-CoA transferase